MIVVALLCLSVVISGLATIRPAAAADDNASAPAPGASGQSTSDQTASNLSSALTQSTSTIADLQSQTPTISLVPYQLTAANQTVSESASSVASATVAANETGGAPSADTTSESAAPTADAVTTNVTQPAAENGSLVSIPVSAGGGGSGLILLTLLSYGAAVIVLGVMRYWSFSFDEGAEFSPELNSANVVDVRGSAYSALENVEYGRTAEGP
jgi:cytoskeletal protein RodZ